MVNSIRNSGIQAIEHRAFRAAWALARVVYDVWDPNFWKKDEGLKSFYLSMLPSTYPAGSLCTTGGIALYTYRGVPNWVETPWGEWHCFYGLSSHLGSNTFNGYEKDGSHLLMRVCENFSIDKSRSRCPYVKSRETGYTTWIDSLVISVKSISDIDLPPRKTKPGTQARHLGEWVAMCINYYPNTVIPRHREGVFQWLREATDDRRNAFKRID